MNIEGDNSIQSKEEENDQVSQSISQEDWKKQVQNPQPNETIKNKPKRRYKKSTNTPIIQNFGIGRPNNQNENEINTENQFPEVEEFWFGSMISTQLLIYLCQEGQLTLKMKTGQPGKEISRQLDQVLNNRAEKAQVVKFKRKFKNQIKLKLEIILQYLGYKKKTKFLLLSKSGSQCYFNLENATFQTIKALQVVSSKISPLFIKSYKLIVEYYFQNCKQQQNQSIIQDLIEIIQQNSNDHKQLLDLQLIRTILDEDLENLKKLEDPFYAIYEFQRQSKVTIISAESLLKCQPPILGNSNWLQSFIEGFIRIIEEGIE